MRSRSVVAGAGLAALVDVRAGCGMLADQVRSGIPLALTLRGILLVRRLRPMAVAVAIVLGFALPGTTTATATSTGVAFSADDLPTWQTDGVVWALGQSRGRVLAGGTFAQVRPPAGSTDASRSLPGLVVLDSETGAPAACQFPLLQAGGSPSVRAITTSPDGATVYIAGSFTSIKDVPVVNVAAVDPVACTVQPMRVGSISSVYALAATADTLYLGGAFTTADGQPRQRFAAVSTGTGALLPWTVNTDKPGRALAISPDGSKVAVGGDFFVVNGSDSHALAVVSGTTGAALRTYPLGFIESRSVTKALTSDGTSFYAGNEGSGGGAFDGSLKVSWTTLDQEWRDTCLGATQAVLVHAGTLYEANHHHNCSSMSGFQNGRRVYLTAQRTSDATMLGWFPEADDGIGEGLGPRALVASVGATTGKTFLWAGGEFTTINGRAQQSLTRFGPDDVGAPPSPAPVAQALSTGFVQVRFRTVVDADDSRLTYKVYRNGSATPTWTGTSDSMWWTRPQVTFVDKSVVAGTRYSYRVTATDAAGNVSAASRVVSAKAVPTRADYAAQVRKDRAVLYWRYDETSGVWAQDSAAVTTNTRALNGLYEKGVARGAAGAVVGDASRSASFDGVDDYLWNDQYKAGRGTYSIETWFKTTTTRGGLLVGYGNGRPRTNSGAAVDSGRRDRQVYMDNTGHVVFGTYKGSVRTVASAKSYNNNRWHHVVATQSSAGMVLYVDGVVVGRNKTAGVQNIEGVWRVGGDRLAGWPKAPRSKYFKGAIDETAVYHVALTSKQVATHRRLSGR